MKVKVALVNLLRGFLAEALSICSEVVHIQEQYLRMLVRVDRIIEEEKGSHLYPHVSFPQELHPK